MAKFMLEKRRIEALLKQVTIMGPPRAIPASAWLAGVQKGYHVIIVMPENIAKRGKDHPRSRHRAILPGGKSIGGASKSYRTRENDPPYLCPSSLKARISQDPLSDHGPDLGANGARGYLSRASAAGDAQRCGQVSQRQNRKFLSLPLG